MAGFANDASGQDVVYANNVDFSGNANVSSQMTTDGQLLIGSTASPHIKPGTITSPSGTVTIGYSSPNITIDVAAGTGVVETLTGNSGPAIAPVLGNINTIGSGSITVAGSGNTLTAQLTGLTNHAVLVGAGTTTITKVGPSATTGQILQSQGSTTDPAFSTATYPSTTTINQILYSSSANVVGGITSGNNGVLISGTTGIPSFLADGTTNQVLMATTGNPPSWGSIASAGAITGINVDTSTSPGTNPVLPSAGLITLTGGTPISAGTNAASLQVKSLAANTIEIALQTAQSNATSQTTGYGIAQFNSTNFGVTSGYVTTNNFTINAGTGLSGGGTITNGGAVTLSASSISFTWTDQSTSFSAAANNGYFVTATATATLPTTPAQGSECLFAVDSVSGKLTIQAPAGASIRSGTTVSATGGTAVSTKDGDSISLVYRVSDLTWIAISQQGVWNIT